MYRGYVCIVGGGKVQPEASKVETVKQFVIPQTKKEVRAFLGLGIIESSFPSTQV